MPRCARTFVTIGIPVISLGRFERRQMRDFISESWREILAHNGLADFEALWALEAGWFETPNERRGGWSGVSRFELQRPLGGTVGVFIKRQKNHRARTILHPVGGVATFEREFQRIVAFQQHGIPSLEPVFFGVRGAGKNQRAILVTAELAGFVPLDALIAAWGRDGVPPLPARLPVIKAVAALAAKMHSCRIRHNCFSPKHVFVRVGTDGQAEARVIDLEKSRSHQLSIDRCAQRDLYSLSHYSPATWRKTDRVRFLKLYLGLPRLTAEAKRLWRNVVARSAEKDESRR